MVVTRPSRSRVRTEELVWPWDPAGGSFVLRRARVTSTAVHAALSPREKEVMALVVAGRLNKQVGGELGISEITVKAHRGKMMRKMRAGTLPELVRMAARLQLTSP